MAGNPGFWQQFQPMSNAQVALGKTFGFINNVFYLFPQGGGPRGSFTTFTSLKSQLQSRDLIILSGALREQAVAPDGIFDVRIVGAANRPRQATSGGTPTGGGATWMAPASGAVAATALLELTRQGWAIDNISFTPHTSSPGILLTRSTTVDLIDASHAEFSNCLFSGQGGTGQVGIQDANGSGFVLVENCRFTLLDSALLSVATGAAVPQGWTVQGCRFQQNTNDIKMSLSYAIIKWNEFLTAGSGSTNKVISTTFISTQGGNNHIELNQFSNTEAEIAPGSGYTGAASDTWMNYVNNQAALAYGQPA